MGLRDTEEMLDACKADAIVLERERDGALTRLRAAEAKLAAVADACTEAEELSASTMGGIAPKVTAKYLRSVLEVTS